MSYEFNPSDARTEHPNPFKVENLFLFICAAVYAWGGALVLVEARRFTQLQETFAAVAAGLLGTALLGFAALLFGRMLSQLRLLLGRKFPRGLAEELTNGQTGHGFGSDAVAEQMRHRALNFPEHEGAIAGLLYTLFKPMAASPAPMQNAALVHLQSLLTAIATLFSLGVSYFMFAGTPYEGVVSWAYLPLTGLSILTPIIQADGNVFQQETKGIAARIGLFVALAVVGPVAIPRFIPAYHIPPMWLAPVLLLVGAIGCFVLFFLSITAHPDTVTETAVSCEQTTIEMNCPPAQLWTEIGREFQNNWTLGIPNRAYVNMPPEVQDTNHGLFNGQILEETQPTATAGLTVTSFKEAWAMPYSRWLVGLMIWAVGLAGVALYLAPHYAAEFADMSRMEISRSILTIIALGTASALAFNMGHLLWSRMYFKSRLTWIELIGTHQMSELDVGNQVTGTVRSRSKLTRVEDATLRIWVTDIVSVAFGKAGKRSIIALAPADGVARTTAERLTEFALNQSMVVAPTSRRDVQHLNRLNAFARGVEVPPLNGASFAQLGAAASYEEGRGEQPTVIRGKVKFYDPAKGFGFVRGEDGVERFFGASQVTGGVKAVVAGQRVQFSPVTNDKGPAAQNVTISL